MSMDNKQQSIESLKYVYICKRYLEQSVKNALFSICFFYLLENTGRGAAFRATAMSATAVAHTARSTTTIRRRTRRQGTRIALLEFTGEVHKRAVVVPRIISGMVRVHIDMVVKRRNGPGLQDRVLSH